MNIDYSREYYITRVIHEEKEPIPGSLHDKILGMFIGGALGDALGSPHELMTQEKNYTGILQFPVVLRSRFNNSTPCYTSIGQVSDDTEMCSLLADSLLENGGYNRKDVLTRYLYWASHETTRAIGKNTKNLFQSSSRGNPIAIETYQKRMAKIEEGARENMQSNGALMRCAPLVFFTQNEFEEDCMLTNPNSFSIETNRIFLNLLAQAFSQPISEKIRTEDIYTRIIYPESSIQLLNDVPRRLGDYISNLNCKQKGWCVYPLASAFYGLQFNRFSDMVDNLILRGGDCDTNACVAGYLWGATYGYTAMKSDPVTSNNIYSLLYCTTTETDIHGSTQQAQAAQKSARGEVKFLPRDIPLLNASIIPRARMFTEMVLSRNKFFKEEY